MRVTFTPDPSPRSIASALGKLSEDFRDWRPALRKLVPVMVRNQQDNLSGPSLGTPWPPLSEATVRRKGHAAQMVLSGELLARAAGGARQISRTHVSIGDIPKYGYMLNYGADGRYSARPWIGWADRALQEATGILSSHSTTLLERAIGRMGGQSV